MTQLAWHYTTVEKFALIMESCELRTTLSHLYGRNKEKPVLWFSMNQFWEGTVVYTREVKGRNVSCSMIETKKAGCGLIRLGYPMHKLIPWIELWKLAGIEPHMKRFLEKAGKEKRSNPYHWMGCFESIPVSNLVVEVMDNHNRWETAKRGLISTYHGKAINVVGDGLHDTNCSNFLFLSAKVIYNLKNSDYVFKSMCKLDQDKIDPSRTPSLSTRSKAIEDGTLVDMSSKYPELCKLFFNFPMCCTDRVWDLINLTDLAPDSGKNKEEVIYDIFHLGRAAYLRDTTNNEYLFSVFITGIGSNNYYELKLALGIGDGDEAVITIMLPDEW